MGRGQGRSTPRFSLLIDTATWQRGRVENAIGLVRTFIPKRTDLRNYSHRRIRQIENNPDSRPMKLHDWLSRSDVYSNYRCYAK